MNRILIIEDDDIKRAHLNAVLTRAFGALDINSARSYQSGLKRLLDSEYDLVILDMTMPTFDVTAAESGGRVRPFAGRDLLEQAFRRGLKCRALVVTGFEILGDGEMQKTLSALDAELRSNFPQLYLGSIHYNPALTEWESKLVAAVTGSFTEGG